METRVKERLIGAVILVVLIVALVPEILSGPRGPTGRARVTEEPLRTYTIDLEERAFPAEPTESESTESEPTETSTPRAEVSGTEPSNAAPPTQDAVAERQTVAQPPAARRPERSAGEKGSDLFSGVTPQENKSDPSSGWAVQLGSFSNAQNAERLASELRAKGYKAFVSRFESSGQKRLRVRVGPEQDRARAEQLAQRLRREGRQAAVVAHP